MASDFALNTLSCQHVMISGWRKHTLLSGGRHCVVDACRLIAVLGQQVHGAPVTVMRYNAVHDVVISSDEKGAPALGSDIRSKVCKQWHALWHWEPMLRVCSLLLVCTKTTAVHRLYTACEHRTSDQVSYVLSVQSMRGCDQGDCGKPDSASLYARASGVIEYWSGTTLKFPAEAVSFRFKLDTDLYALAKAKTAARALEVSRDGAQFVITSADRCIPLLSRSGTAWAGVSACGPSCVA